MQGEMEPKGEIEMNLRNGRWGEIEMNIRNGKVGGDWNEHWKTWKLRRVEGVLDLHKSGNEWSLDLYKSGNELSLDLYKSSNEFISAYTSLVMN